MKSQRKFAKTGAILLSLMMLASSMPWSAFAVTLSQTQVAPAGIPGNISAAPLSVANPGLGNASLQAPSGAIGLNASLSLPQTPVPGAATLSAPVLAPAAPAEIPAAVSPISQSSPKTQRVLAAPQADKPQQPATPLQQAEAAAAVTAQDPSGKAATPESGSQASASAFDGSSLKKGEYVDVSAFGEGGVKVREPRKTVLDPFGRDIGWDKMPQEPAEAPRSIKDADISIPADAKYTPSPKDWRDEVFYSVIVDRFARSAPYTTWGEPADGRTRHGGNIRGLIEKLDYLKGLGASTILVNPLVMSPPSGSHQYWALHFLAVDPQIGTMAEFKQLVAEAHKRGMRIVLDLVMNHTGPVAEYEGGFKFGPARKIVKWNYPIKPVELQADEHFSRRGDINNWDDPDQIKHGDLPGGINHMNTENPATQDILLTVAKWWLKQTDVDGFRLDVYKHVAPSFWQRFFKEVREYGAKLGKNNLMIVGELYDGNPANLAPEVKPGRLDSAYNYPAYYWNYAALHGEAATKYLEGSFQALREALGHGLDYLVHFLDNHDRPHFLRPNDPAGILRFALSFVLLSVGIPYLYYGDEQDFRQVPEHAWLDLEQSREDMFPEGKFRNPAAPKDGFNTKSPFYKLVSALSGIRRNHAALRRGEQYVRWSDPNGPGIFAFSRIYNGEEVLVVLNSAGEARTAEMWVDSNLTPAGAKLVDEMDSGYAATAHGVEGGGAKVYVQIPPYGVRVLVRGR